MKQAGRKQRLSKAEKADIKVARAVAVEADSAKEKLFCFGELGDQPPLTAASVTMLVCGLAFRERRMARSGARMLAALGLATLLKSAVKNNVDRTRPHVMIEERRYGLRPGDSDEGQLRSFPSGHSAGAAAVFRAAARDYPNAFAPLAVTAASIAAAQLPTRNHFLTDVLTGVALGLAAEWIVSAALDRVDEEFARATA